MFTLTISKNINGDNVVNGEIPNFCTLIRAAKGRGTLASIEPLGDYGIVINLPDDYSLNVADGKIYIGGTPNSQVPLPEID